MVYCLSFRKVERQVRWYSGRACMLQQKQTWMYSRQLIDSREFPASFTVNVKLPCTVCWVCTLAIGAALARKPLSAYVGIYCTSGEGCLWLQTVKLFLSSGLSYGSKAFQPSSTAKQKLNCEFLRTRLYYSDVDFAIYTLHQLKHNQFTAY